ncbi:hypothetical protein [Streptomyces sp. NPDC046197]|uniref:hypothetical protein n=1 Tax=Streptomyces sp. NPDC046197 TaxID=3154337 RepID=UPI0033E5F658
MSFVGIRDPHILASIAEWARLLRRMLTDRVQGVLGLTEDEWDANLRLYGHNAVLDDLETSSALPREVGAMLLVSTPDQATAMADAATAGLRSWRSRVPTLGELALEVRAKNAGPFWLTLEAFMADDAGGHRHGQPGLPPRRDAGRDPHADRAGRDGLLGVHLDPRSGDLDPAAVVVAGEAHLRDPPLHGVGPVGRVLGGRRLLRSSLPTARPSPAHRAATAGPRRGLRSLRLPGLDACEVDVYDRHALAPGFTVRSPAVFEEHENSCAIGPDCTASIDAHRNLVIDIDYTEGASP